jgi:hypothetical protein
MVAMVVVVMVELKRDEGCRWERKVRRGKDGKEWVIHRERRRAFLKERRREQSRQARERERDKKSVEGMWENKTFWWCTRRGFGYRRPSELVRCNGGWAVLVVLNVGRIFFVRQRFFYPRRS